MSSAARKLLATTSKGKLLGKKKKTLAIVTILVVIVATILFYEAEAPIMLAVQTNAELQHSLLSFSKSYSNMTITDSSGSYTFFLGFDYPDTPVPSGASTVFKMYAALTQESITSGFTRGVSLMVQSATLLIDNVPDYGVKLVTNSQPTLFTEQFEFVNTSLPTGPHQITARLYLSTVDVYYLGYFPGSSEIVQLNGTFTIG